MERIAPPRFDDVTEIDIADPLGGFGVPDRVRFEIEVDGVAYVIRYDLLHDRLLSVLRARNLSPVLGPERKVVIAKLLADKVRYAMYGALVATQKRVVIE